MMRTIVTFALFVATLASAQGFEAQNGYVSKQDSLLQDYDYFFSQLEQIHPDPYSAFGGKEGFDKAVKQLRDELANRDSLTLNEMQVEVTKLISALHDGHTYMGYEIYVVTDVQTFSSAFHTAYMLWKMGAKVVGVTSGQAPNTFMEVTRFKLPNTGLECSVSNSLQSCFPTDHPMAKTFTPDIQLSYDDYRQFDFSKDAELLFIEKLCSTKKSCAKKL